MSFKSPYQKSTGKTVHRKSRKARYSATIGYLKGRSQSEYRRTTVSFEPAKAPGRGAY